MQVLHQGGGAGSVTSTLHLSLGLEQAGFHVRFVCPPHSEVEGLARAGGLEVHPVSLEPGARRTNAAKLEALLRRFPVDLVNSQSSRDRAALAWLAWTRRLNVPLIVTRRQMPQTMVLENWLVSRMATRVVAVSRHVAEALRRRGTGRNKLVVIPNGLIVSRVDAPVTTAQIDQWRDRIRMGAFPTYPGDCRSAEGSGGCYSSSGPGVHSGSPGDGRSHGGRQAESGPGATPGPTRRSDASLHP